MNYERYRCAECYYEGASPCPQHANSQTSPEWIQTPVGLMRPQTPSEAKSASEFFMSQLSSEERKDHKMESGDLLLVAGDLARFVRYNESGKTITVVFDGETGESVVSVRHCRTQQIAAIQEARRLLSLAESSDSLKGQMFLGRKAAEVLSVFEDQPNSIEP